MKHERVGVSGKNGNGRKVHAQPKETLVYEYPRTGQADVNEAATPARKGARSRSWLLLDGLVRRKVAAVKSQSAWRHIKVVDTNSRRQREHSVDVIESVTKHPLPEIAHAQSGKITLTGGERTVLA